MTKPMKLVYIEPFDGGHTVILRAPTGKIDADWTVLTLPGRHWKWRSRGSAVCFAEAFRDIFEMSTMSLGWFFFTSTRSHCTRTRSEFRTACPLFSRESAGVPNAPRVVR